MKIETETPQHAVRCTPPLERLANAYLLRLFLEATRTQRPLRQILRQKESLSAALDLDEEIIAKESAAQLAPRIAQRLAEVEEGDDLLDCAPARSVLRFGQGFGLSLPECQILLLTAIAASDSYLDDELPSGSSTAGHDLDYLVAVSTGLDLATVRAALSPQGLLVRSGILRRYDRNYDFSDRLQLIDSMAPALLAADDASSEVSHRWLLPVPAATLKLEAVSHLRSELETAIAVLKGALQRGKPGVQILLHGEPGVGKTQLARLIATETGACACLLPDESSEGTPLSADQRLRRFAFMQRLLAQQPRPLIILDEVEDMLASTEQWGWVQGGAKPSSAQKAWKNRLIEDSAVSGIWIANWIHAIDPALLRRFTLVLHVPNPPARQRVAILAGYRSDYAEDAQLRTLIAEREDISPADIGRAHAAAQLATGHSSGNAASQFLRALALRANTDCDPIVTTRSAIPKLPYRLTWLNTDPPLDDIVPLLAESGSARLCFWGPPGTGKTALAQHLAERLDRPLMVKKASDLISCWLGQTERNLAKAFADARRSGAFLLIDEADSFLRSRDGAARAYEVTEVNQLLKELENFEGLVALCTNYFETLDAAVLRRLDLKVHFSRMRAEAAREAFLEAARSLGCSEDNARDVISQLPLPGDRFALGDIAVAMRQARLRSKTPSAELLRDCLEAEWRTRQTKEGRPIGFVRA